MPDGNPLSYLPDPIRQLLETLMGQRQRPKTYPTDFMDDTQKFQMQGGRVPPSAPPAAPGSEMSPGGMMGGNLIDMITAVGGPMTTPAKPYPTDFMGTQDKFEMMGGRVPEQGLEEGLEVDVVDSDDGEMDADIPVTAQTDELGPAYEEASSEMEDETTGLGGGNTYTIRRGDTLWDLAEKFYGDPNKYRQIAIANGINNPDQISVGQVIKLPSQNSPIPRSRPEMEEDEAPVS
jgi:nucleoid-associated protein YgaU